MEATVGTAHCRYRIAGGSSPGALQSRLDDRLRRELPDAIDRAVTPAFGSDRAVYIVRRLRMNAIIRSDRDVPAPSSVDAFACAFAAALAREIARGNSDNVVVFADRATYLASFVHALFDGSGRDSWVFRSLRRYAELPLPEALDALFTSHRSEAPAILVAIERAGLLPRVLQTLPARALQSLWNEGIRPMPRRESLRPLFAAAFTLADRLALWTAARPAEPVLFDQWAAEDPSDPDWSSREALSQTVAAAIHWLAARGLLIVTGPARAHASQALAEMDWLDTRVALGATAAVSPHTRPPRATPDQVRLATVLLNILAGLPFEPGPLDSELQHIRLYSTLASRHEEWSDPGIAAPVIERLLTACAALQSSRAPADTVRSLLRGDIEAALATLPLDIARTAPALRFVAALGPPAIEAIARAAQIPLAAEEIATDCAGIFLLLRTISAVRLRAACQAAGYPSFPALLAVLALRWAGSIPDDDPGIAIFSGWTGSREELRDLWNSIPPEAHQRFSAELELTLRAQRLAFDEEETSDRLLRAWARWLRQFAQSSLDFLLREFIRRPGHLRREGDRIVVRLYTRPLDIVLSLAGYFDDIEPLPPLAIPGVRFLRSSQ